MGRALFVMALVLSLAACQGDPVAQETEALTLAPENLAQRQLQMRRFDTNDETRILAATSGVLQDLGFTVDEGSATTGFLVASKDRDAMEAGQVAGQMVLAAIVAALGGRADPVYDRNQKIRISIVTKAAANNDGTVVRVTFQRVIWNNKNQISRVETIDDAPIYQQFFEKLSESVFLEAHSI